MRPDRSVPRDAAARIGRLAVRALLREVAVAPKPGLVDRKGSGSHGDMDFMTFADSALALGPAFVACARAGWAAGKADPSLESLADGAFLTSLRPIGLEAERTMFAATGGVNTHKGALFILGLLAAAAGALLGAALPFRRVAESPFWITKPPPSLDPDETLGVPRDFTRACRDLSARVAKGVSSAELPGSTTHGAAAYRAHGLSGVRGEVESGLSSLDFGALDLLLAAPRPLGDPVCVEALLRIMTVAADTTLVHRGGLPALHYVREEAQRVLSLGALRSLAGRAALGDFSTDMVSRGLSPGGSADLLAAALFLADLERTFAMRLRTHQGPSMKTRCRAILSVSV